MNQREEIPLTVEWIRRVRQRRYEQNKDRPRTEAWRENVEAARKTVAAFGVAMTDGPGRQDTE